MATSLAASVSSALLPQSDRLSRAAAGGSTRCALPSPGFSASALAGSPLATPRARRAGVSSRGASRRGNGALLTQCNLVQKVSAKELESLLNAEEREKPLVIDFYATWCGPCVILAQQLEQLAVEYSGTVQFLKVDTDEEYDLANQLEIRGLPTLVFVNTDKQKLAKRTEGVLPIESLKELIEELE